MEQKDANAIVTEIPTPAGQPITTDTVFDLFASLVPDSPWAERLRKIKRIFNHLATGATLLTTIPGWSLGDQIYSVKEREAKGWDGPNVKQFSQGITELLNGAHKLGAKAIEPAPAPDPLPALEEPINTMHLAAATGALIENDDEPEIETTLQFTKEQLDLFLAEYRRALIQGE